MDVAAQGRLSPEPDFPMPPFPLPRETGYETVVAQISPSAWGMGNGDGTERVLFRLGISSLLVVAALDPPRDWEA
jgi:hypothetical protein